MSNPKSLQDTIDNGLAIAQFIQENRDTIQATYGRSSIEEPSTADRTRAWELFIDKTSAKDAGSERSQKVNGGKSKKKSKTPETNHAKASPDVSKPKSSEDQSTSSRGDSGRDGESDPESNGGRRTIHTENIHDTAAGGSANTPRASKLEAGSQDHNSDNGSDRHGVRENIDGDPNQGVEGEFLKAKETVKETNQEDLDKILEETKPVPKRRLKNASAIKEAADSLPPANIIVKKTTGGSMQYTTRERKPSSGAGATQSVPPSDQRGESTNADVENAQDTVQSANQDHKISQNEEFTDSSERGRRLLKIEEKIDMILDNQEKIMRKLDIVAEVREELIGIKKSIANQSLAISTIENYISEMMIIIPKSGQPEQPGIGTDQRNPDLRPVIGRDSTRGLKDVRKSAKEGTKIEIDDNFFTIPEVDDKYILKPINNDENNAAHFVPTEDENSYEIIENIIIRDAPNRELTFELLDLFRDNIGTIPVTELYNSITGLLYDTD